MEKNSDIRHNVVRFNLSPKKERKEKEKENKNKNRQE